MRRRDFLKGALVAGAAAAVPPALAGCGMAPVRPDGAPEPLPVDALLRQGARTMDLVAHPDDECFCGTLLARASLFHGNPLQMLVLTHGDGGECNLKGGCKPDLATVRGAEMRRAADLYKAELQHERYWNAPLPVESFPKRHEIFAKWAAQADPVALAARTIRRFRPDLLLTFGPDYGMTGHPEHQLASRIATAAARLANDPAAALDGLAPHRVTRVYHVLNRYWPMRAAGACDPGPVTETWDAYSTCRGRESCLEFMCESTRVHETQAADMWNVRYFRQAFETVYLRQVDWTRPEKLPDEPGKNWG